MSALGEQISLPLATNMCVVESGHIPGCASPRDRRLIDHHHWGGFRASMDVAALCRIHGIMVSMHSNSHHGIGLSGMVQLGAAIGNLDYALGTRRPWKRPEDADSAPAASGDGTTLTDLAGAR